MDVSNHQKRWKRGPIIWVSKESDFKIESHPSCHRHYYDITQHWSQAKSLSLELVRKFISRTISAKTSFTFILLFALLSMNEQFQICARAWKERETLLFFKEMDFFLECTDHWPCLRITRPLKHFTKAPTRVSLTWGGECISSNHFWDHSEHSPFT